MPKEDSIQVKGFRQIAKRSTDRLQNEKEKFCIIHFERNKSDKEIRNLSEYSFARIKEVASLRKSSKDEDTRLEVILPNIPERFDALAHGSHRWCYQNFTNVSRLKRKAEDDETASVSSDSSHVKRSRRSCEYSSSAAVLFPADKCLFCNNKWLKTKHKKHGLVKCVTKIAETSIKSAAERKNDTEMLRSIRDVDLVAREAHYHNNCRRDYTRDESRHSTNDESETSAMLEAHRNAFDFLCNYIEENIINLMKVERMTMLRERYLLFIAENNPEAHNEYYKTDKLKDKLKKHFGNKIQFWRPSSQGELVYSDGISTGQAIETAFELACSDDRKIEEAAMIVRRRIIEGQRTSERMPFPPTAAWLSSEERQTPKLLQNFIARVVSGKSVNVLSEKSRRFVSSCSQDICYATSNGEWIMPKHVLLATTIHHITGSAVLVTLLSRFGHCQSYSRTLELETAICNSIAASNSVLPPNISVNNNDVVHCCWDNFDLNEETPSGAGTTHTSHGIIIQEVSGPVEEHNHCLPQIEMSHDRSVRHPIITELQPCFIKEKGEPQLLATITMPEPHDFSYVMQADFLWMLCRNESSEDEQIVPSLAGWLSAISTEPCPVQDNQQSTVDYMAPVLFPITEYSTVQHILELSQEATYSVGQEFTIVTFDLGVAMKACPILWQNTSTFSNVILRIGVFHILCSLFGALGKHMQGSGFEDVVIEAGICASGSLTKVMSGKHYNRALRVHKLVLEGLERLLFQLFEQSEDTELSDTLRDAVHKLSETPNSENFQNVINDNEMRELYLRYNSFKNDVRNGKLGKTAQYWMGYMDLIWLILTLIRATKENNFDLHLSTLYKLCPLFFAYNHHNYARYLPVYLITMLNLSETHPGAEILLRRNGFSVSRSSVPLSRNPVDITIEQTINRHAKSHGGIIGFSRNYAAYYRWCVTRHSRATFVEATMNMADMAPNEAAVHKELRPSQKKSSEASVKKIMEAFSNFINPFAVENQDELYCLSSGAPATSEIASDLLEAYELGQEVMETFIQDRFVNKTSLFHDPIKRTKLKTFASLEKRQKIKSTQNKLVEIRAERNTFAQLALLSMQNDIDLEMTMSYQLGPVPWALATADGMPVKSNKAKLLHKLEELINPSDRPHQMETVYICDGNALLQAMLGIPATFGDVAEKVFDLLPKTRRVDFVTDTYTPNSIKAFERSRRGTAPKFLLAGPKTRTPRDWKLFMSNDGNKTQLIDLLLSEWQKPRYSQRLQGRDLYFVCGEECFHLTSDDGVTIRISSIQDLSSNQEEADTRIILHCYHIARSCPSNFSIVVRSPDTDVLVLLVKFSQQIDQVVLFDTGVGNKRRLLNVKDIVAAKGEELCSVLPAFHAFTGCDTTSSFVRRGKVGPLKVLEKNPRFLSTFHSLGQRDNVSETTLEELERFVCYMYGKPRYNSIDKLRYDMFRQKYQPKAGNVLTSADGVDLSLLPPCKASLHMHVVRSNYQALIWNRAQDCHPLIPNPINNGWKLGDDGNLTVDWNREDIMPQELIDIVCESELADEREATIDEDYNDDDGDEYDEAVEINNILDVLFEDYDDE